MEYHSNPALVASKSQEPEGTSRTALPFSESNSLYRFNRSTRNLSPISSALNCA